MKLDGAAGACANADAAAFCAAFWAVRPRELDQPAHRAAHFQRMLARPAVQRTLAAEGLAG